MDYILEELKLLYTRYQNLSKYHYMQGATENSVEAARGHFAKSHVFYNCKKDVWDIMVQHPDFCPECFLSMRHSKCRNIFHENRELGIS